jgi:hypothetical protein
MAGEIGLIDLENKSRVGVSRVVAAIIGGALRANTRSTAAVSAIRPQVNERRLGA